MHIPDGQTNIILSVITPISKMAGKLENLTDWLTEIAAFPVQAIIVHDLQDELTGPELDRLISTLANPRITIIHKYCGSPGAARNLGFTFATADWVCFWDSDDRPRVPEFLEMVGKASESMSDFCVGAYAEVTPEAMVHHPLGEVSSFEPAQLLQNPGVWRMGFNRQFVKVARFAESCMAEDQYFLSSLTLSSSKLHVSDKTVYEYYTNFGSQLTKNRSALSDIPKVLRLLFNLKLTVSSADQNDFINNVIGRVSLTGIMKAKLKTKIEILRIISGKIHLDRSKIFYNLVKILITKLTESFSPSKTPSLNVKLYGGLGNQLFQLAAGLAIAGNRKLTLEIDLKCSDGAITQLVMPSGVNFKFFDSRKKRANLFLRLCNLSLRLSTYPELSIGKRIIGFFSKTVLSILLSLRDRARVEILRPRGLGYSDVTSSAKHQFLVGYMQSYVWSEDLAVRDQLVGIRLRKRNAQLDSMVRDVRSKKVLGVHVRLGDYLANPQFGQLDEDYYRRAIQNGMERYEFDSIWIFSNDISTAQSQLEFLEHTGLLVTWVDDSLLSSAELIFLISNCAGIVLANSSFGWWAARLSLSAGQYIAAPVPWFSEIDSPRSLIPIHWLQIDSSFGKRRR